MSVLECRPMSSPGIEVGKKRINAWRETQIMAEPWREDWQGPVEPGSGSEE